MSSKIIAAVMTGTIEGTTSSSQLEIRLVASLKGYITIAFDREGIERLTESAEGVDLSFNDRRALLHRALTTEVIGMLTRAGILELIKIQKGPIFVSAYKITDSYAREIEVLGMKGIIPIIPMISRPIE
jgi:hypothetical protein